VPTEFKGVKTKCFAQAKIFGIPSPGKMYIHSDWTAEICIAHVKNNYSKNCHISKTYQVMNLQEGDIAYKTHPVHFFNLESCY
jgi:hypothetical protein